MHVVRPPVRHSSVRCQLLITSAIVLKLYVRCIRAVYNKRVLIVSCLLKRMTYVPAAEVFWAVENYLLTKLFSIAQETITIKRLTKTKLFSTSHAGNYHNQTP